MGGWVGGFRECGEELWGEGLCVRFGFESVVGKDGVGVEEDFVDGDGFRFEWEDSRGDDC